MRGWWSSWRGGWACRAGGADAGPAGNDGLRGGSGILEPKFKDLHSPFLLPNMDAAAERIVRRCGRSRRLRCMGLRCGWDHGTAMLWHTLKEAVPGRLLHPHRVDEGYGLNEEAVRGLRRMGRSCW